MRSSAVSEAAIIFWRQQMSRGWVGRNAEHGFDGGTLTLRTLQKVGGRNAERGGWKTCCVCDGGMF
eukprot:1139884-Pelagomonas_calceolata.AAC.5